MTARFPVARKGKYVSLPIELVDLFARQTTIERHLTPEPKLVDERLAIRSVKAVADHVKGYRDVAW
jgi:hypothetical protein